MQFTVTGTAPRPARSRDAPRDADSTLAPANTRNLALVEVIDPVSLDPGQGAA